MSLLGVQSVLGRAELTPSPVRNDASVAQLTSVTGNGLMWIDEEDATRSVVG